MTTRRRLITAAIASALPLCHGPMAHAQEFPSKPVTLYTAFAPGSGPDAVRDRINADVNAALSDPEIKARFETFAFESPAWSPAEIEKQAAVKSRVYSELIARKSISLD